MANSSVTHIKIRGAGEHNLKNISVDIPKHTLTVITGLSGSGKSSLAFDTIYAEGQRRFVESLSAYARQFLNLSNKPKVDSIEGLSPAIAIDQKTTNKNPRSTVGTITEVHDYLRLLFAQTGIPHCPTHKTPISAQTISQMVDAIMAWPEGTRLQLIAPVVRGRKGEYKKELQEWQKKGFTRVRVNGEVFDIANTPELNKNLKHTIEIIVDRLAVRPDVASRLAESLETALKLADGMAIAEPVAQAEEQLAPSLTFSEKYACTLCGHTVPELEPRMFSFNSPYGACQTCDGLGQVVYFNPDLIIDASKPLDKGGIIPWGDVLNNVQEEVLITLSKEYGFNYKKPYSSLSEGAQEALMYGAGNVSVVVADTAASGRAVKRTFKGLIPQLEYRWRTARYPWQRDELAQFRSQSNCPTCNGDRLNEDALHVLVDGQNIAHANNVPIHEAVGHFKNMAERLKGRNQEIAKPILKEINARLGFLEHVGLGYLSLARKSGTLSGGESQRIRLASQIGSGLTGVLYVLDEPSIGLHQRDNDRLLESLKSLRDLDNTIIVVEHDEDAIRQADWVIDMGPGAGEQGGHVVAEGNIEALLAEPTSITGQFLSGKRSIAVPKKRRPVDTQKHALHLKGASSNNLKNVDVSFPLNALTCVTGVSGSGKSTLTLDTLHNAVAHQMGLKVKEIGQHTLLGGVDKLDKIIEIDQSPIGRTPRSNPATYTGVMSPIRDWFVGLPEAKARGYKSGRFSFNVKGGRCEACEGDGLIKVEMHFLADVYVQCDVCKGKRYNRETLEVTYRDKSIADVLDMTVEDALHFFQDIPAIRNKLKTLTEVGLGYIRLGQSATTLSGGEAQRIKLAKELARRATGNTLYILDEPTTGLHFHDIDVLLKALHKLVDDGNTMVVIEHNLDVIKTADWLIDMGPEGGDAGGEVIACGTPEEVANHKTSHTGRYLKPLLAAKAKTA